MQSARKEEEAERSANVRLMSRPTASLLVPSISRERRATCSAPCGYLATACGSDFCISSREIVNLKQEKTLTES